MGDASVYVQSHLTKTTSHATRSTFNSQTDISSSQEGFACSNPRAAAAHSRSRYRSGTALDSSLNDDTSQAESNFPVKPFTLNIADFIAKTPENVSIMSTHRNDDDNNSNDSIRNASVSRMNTRSRNKLNSSLDVKSPLRNAAVNKRRTKTSSNNSNTSEIVVDENSKSNDSDDSRVVASIHEPAEFQPSRTSTLIPSKLLLAHQHATTEQDEEIQEIILPGRSGHMPRVANVDHTADILSASISRLNSSKVVQNDDADDGEMLHEQPPPPLPNSTPLVLDPPALEKSLSGNDGFDGVHGAANKGDTTNAEFELSPPIVSRINTQNLSHVKALLQSSMVGGGAAAKISPLNTSKQPQQNSRPMRNSRNTSRVDNSIINNNNKSLATSNPKSAPAATKSARHADESFVDLSSSSNHQHQTIPETMQLDSQPQPVPTVTSAFEQQQATSPKNQHRSPTNDVDADPAVVVVIAPVPEIRFCQELVDLLNDNNSPNPVKSKATTTADTVAEPLRRRSTEIENVQSPPSPLDPSLLVVVPQLLQNAPEQPPAAKFAGFGAASGKNLPRAAAANSAGQRLFADILNMPDDELMAEVQQPPLQQQQPNANKKLRSSNFEAPSTALKATGVPVAEPPSPGNFPAVPAAKFSGFAAASGRRLDNAKSNDIGKRLFQDILDMPPDELMPDAAAATTTAAAAAAVSPAAVSREPGFNTNNQTPATNFAGGFTAGSGRRLPAPTTDGTNTSAADAQNNRAAVGRRLFQDILDMRDDELLAHAGASRAEGAKPVDTNADSGFPKPLPPAAATTTSAATTPARYNNRAVSNGATSAAAVRTAPPPPPRSRPFKRVVPKRTVATGAIITTGAAVSAANAQNDADMPLAVQPARRAAAATTVQPTSESAVQTDSVAIAEEAGGEIDDTLREPLRWMRNLASRGLLDLSSQAAFQRSIYRHDLYSNVELVQIMNNSSNVGGVNNSLERAKLMDWTTLWPMQQQQQQHEEITDSAAMADSPESKLEQLRLRASKRVTELLIPNSRTFLMAVAQRKPCRQLIEPSLVSRLLMENNTKAKTTNSAATAVVTNKTNGKNEKKAGNAGAPPSRGVDTIPIDLLEVFVLKKTPLLYAERMPHGGPLVYRSHEDEQLAERLFRQRKFALMQRIYSVVKRNVYGGGGQTAAAVDGSADRRPPFGGAGGVNSVTDIPIEEIIDVEQVYELLTTSDDPLGILVRATKIQLDGLKPFIDVHRMPPATTSLRKNNSSFIATVPGDRLPQMYEQVVRLHEKDAVSLGTRNVTTLCRLYVMCLHSFNDLYCRHELHMDDNNRLAYYDEVKYEPGYWFGKENYADSGLVPPTNALILPQQQQVKKQSPPRVARELLREELDSCHAVITIWRPDQEMCEQLPQQAYVQMFNLSISGNQRKHSAAELLLLSKLPQNATSSNVNKHQQQQRTVSQAENAASNKPAALEFSAEQIYMASQILTLNGSTKQMRMRNMANPLGSSKGERSQDMLACFENIMQAYKAFLLQHNFS